MLCIPYLLSGGSGTIDGASRKLTAFPKLLNTIAIPVAVVLSPGGNQAEDTAEGAENTIIPAIPFRIAHVCDNLKINLHRNVFNLFCPGMFK